MRAWPVIPRLSFCKMVILVAVAAMLGAALRPAAAQDWPTRPITIVVAFPAGGSLDFVARAIAHNLTDVFGQPVVVKNEAGGGGAIASTSVARAAPDGYTLLVSAIGPMVFRPLMDKTSGYDADKDFTPIIQAADGPNVILANPKHGFNTVKDLLAYAGKQQNKISIAHPGPGTMGHLCALLFAKETHVDGNLIAYRGAPPMIVDLLGGQIDIGVPSYGPGSDSVKILAVTSDKRVNFLPEVPTLKESGINVVCSTWIAVYAPPNLPTTIAAKLNAAMDAFLRKPETAEKFSRIGLHALGGTIEQLRQRAASDRAKWSPIISTINFNPAK